MVFPSFPESSGGVCFPGVSSLFYCHIRAPLLLAALGSLLSGLLAVHVLMSKDPKGAKQ